MYSHTIHSWNIFLNELFKIVKTSLPGNSDCGEKIANEKKAYSKKMRNCNCGLVQAGTAEL